MTNLIGSSNITERLAQFAIAPARGGFAQSARAFAKLSMLDWAACALAGRDEPAGQIVRRMVAAEGGKTESFVFGLNEKLPARAAALANGTISHALDYDDTHFDYIGHPSVVIMSAVLAMSGRTGASGAAMIEAFLIGVETASRIGQFFGRAHYQHGFHQTATSGAFGASAACARLLGLDVTQTRHALGLTATRASGLKSQFGTMGKPFNAGLAASNGVETASLAALGFESRVDGIECEQGFADTHAASGADVNNILRGLGDDFRFEQIQYKYHACCHGTHATLEALRAIRDNSNLDPARIESITLRVHPRWLRVCNIEKPATGLEAKFSYRLTSAMMLARVDTGALDSYTDALCARPDLVRLRDLVRVETDEALADTEAFASVRASGGQVLEQHFDLNNPVPIAVQQDKILKKAQALIGADKARALWAIIGSLENSTADQLVGALRNAQD